MTQKFIPFDPNTAKNGDIVYGVMSRDSYVYIGNDTQHSDSAVLWDMNSKHYCWVAHNNLCIEQPKKTVWINLYGGYEQKGYWYNNEEAAKRSASCHYFIGTFPIEIPA